MSVRADFDRLMVPTYAPAPFVLVRAEGSRVWDSEGRERIDYTGGIAVNVLGHCHPVLVETLRMQAGEMWHVSNAYTNEPALRLARRLTDATFAERVFFCNSGAEANEAAFKLARRVAFDRDGEGRYEIVAAHGSFHGRSLFTVSVGGQPKYSEGFGPAIDGIRHVPFNDLDALRAAVSGSTCAVVLEPVQGEGGVIPADLEYLQGARDICNEHGALLIFDEVQTGVGRVGELYAYQHYGVTPDILTSAKGLGGGFPIGAMLTRADLAVHFPPGTHGTTYGGNPLACSVADAVLSVVDSDEVRQGVIRRRAAFVDQLDALAVKHSIFGPARGLGLLIGCPLLDNWKGLAKVIVTAAAEEGVLLLQAGPDVLRFAPSLVIDPQDIDEGLRRLDRALSKISEARA
ncbi:acetylornithine/succinylornithine family transaminase [Pseudomonas brenneri]|uniref:acetylornithine/succinylornithine family transaminase n=1 Tax=Pseudomonas brenneri TaxID=129817 RepID=UPI0018A2A391|nr:acetylornithine/succinylornithine family transaminase [Pseudomonas brenneri]MBF8008096.1 acetylornithine/succinylornithine family transaminase [Pseudomonas brenneri]